MNTLPIGFSKAFKVVTVVGIFKRMHNHVHIRKAPFLQQSNLNARQKRLELARFTYKYGAMQIGPKSIHLCSLTMFFN